MDDDTGATAITVDSASDSRSVQGGQASGVAGGLALGDDLSGKPLRGALSADSQGLSHQLQQHAREFNFFKAVHLLETQHRDKLAVGFQGPVAQEVVRFRGHPSLGFPSSDIHQIQANALGQLELETNFAGLYGPSSPMPVHVTESIIVEQNSIESEDLAEYFLCLEHQVRALRDQRLNITQLVAQASGIKKQIQAGTLHARRLSDAELEELRTGDGLAAILSDAEREAFRAQKLALHIYERPSARQRDFLDLFNHRLISLFYRCWKKYHPEFQYQAGATDDFSRWLFALMGAPDAQARQASALCWPRLLGYLGLLSMQARSANTLTAVVSGYFEGIPVEVEEHVPRWAYIPDAQRCRLGLGCSVLGDTVSLGARVRDRSGKFLVRLGPLSKSAFVRFLPTGEDHAALRELVIFLMPQQLLFDIELRLAAEAESQPDLSSSFALQAGGGQLGWSTWLSVNNASERSLILKGC
ncbi:MAG: type VI secretion system ImpH/TssG family protein [Motiliproteus sp.]|jgi:type VI secretion system ImpH/TssG family protein